MGKITTDDTVYVSDDGKPRNTRPGMVTRRFGRGKIEVHFTDMYGNPQTIICSPKRWGNDKEKVWVSRTPFFVVFPENIIRDQHPGLLPGDVFPYKVMNRNKRVYYVMAKSDEHAAEIAEMKGIVMKRVNAITEHLGSEAKLPAKYRKAITSSNRARGGMIHV